VLALMGAALGIAIAIWATESMRAVPIIGSFPIRFQTNLDLASLGFAVALGIACGLIFGAAPAAQLSRVNPQAALQSGSRNGGRSALRNALMGVEVALALAVLLAAALFWRGFNDARGADPGFRREGVLLANYDYTGRNIGPAASRDFAAASMDVAVAPDEVVPVTIAGPAVSRNTPPSTSADPRRDGIPTRFHFPLPPRCDMRQRVAGMSIGALRGRAQRRRCHSSAAYRDPSRTEARASRSICTPGKSLR